mgnify:FL=1
MPVFEATDKLKRKIKFTAERKAHISLRHPEIIEFDVFESVLAEPDIIKSSIYDDKVLLYYKEVGKDYRYLAIVVKVLNGEGFILTAYKTNIIKEGKVVWKN